MTLFEYLVAAFALLYSLAALRLIGGISVALAPSRRYWPHLLLTCRSSRESGDPRGACISIKELLLTG